MITHFFYLDDRRVAVIQPTDSTNFGDHIQYLDTLHILASYGRLRLAPRCSRVDVVFIAGHTFGYGVDLWQTVKRARKLSRRIVLLPSSLALYKLELIEKDIVRALEELELAFVRGKYSWELIRERFGLSPHIACDQVAHYFSSAPLLEPPESGLVVGAPRYDYALVYPRKPVIRRACEIILRSDMLVVASTNDSAVVLLVEKPVHCLYVSHVHQRRSIYGMLVGLLRRARLVYSMRFHFGLAAAIMGVPTVFVNPLYEYKALDVLGDRSECLVDIHCSITRAKPCTLAHLRGQCRQSYKRLLDLVGSLL